jgi:ribulose-phosphate 3-epimerase
MRITELLRNLRPALSVGALSADIMSLAAEISLLERNNVRLLHFDVMDGHFAPQLTAGPWFVKALKTALLKDVHLMIENPYDAIPAYAAAGADIITVHVESGGQARAALQRIALQKNANDEGRGIASGIAITPSSPVHAIEPFLEEADIVTIVAVNPGLSGQSIDKALVRRAEQARTMIEAAGRDILLCIDGGVTPGTMEIVAQTRPDMVISGSAVFEKHAVAANLDSLNSVLRGERLS